MNRRHFLAATAATCSSGLALPARSATTTVTTQFLWIKNVEYAGFYIADASGGFRREGIAPVFQAGGPNLASVEAIVASGRADVGIDDLEKVVDAVDRGTDFVVIGAIYQRGVGGLLSLPKNTIRKPADIVGKRMGLPQGTKEYIDGILTINKLPLTYTEVPVGFDPQSLVEGACDGYVCYVTAQPLDLAARKIPYVLTSFADLGWISYDGCLFVTREYAQKNRATLVHYLRALADGWAQNARDAKLGTSLTVNTYGGGLGLVFDQQLAQNRAQIPLTQSDETRRHGTLWMSKETIASRAYATYRASGRKNLPDVDRLIDLSFLQEAAAGRHT